ncbi:MAG: 50S ribosomal protein L35 [Phycisphaerae bacterium]|nr:50S ribosomal protein L35 [Phycisphaerae bacterium]
MPPGQPAAANSGATGTMPNKMKSHKGIQRRFKVGARGKVKSRKPGTSHLLSNKTGKRLRHLRTPLTIQSKAMAYKIKRLMPK